jgi:hypothetical protein
VSLLARLSVLSLRRRWRTASVIVLGATSLVLVPVAAHAQTTQDQPGIPMLGVYSRWSDYSTGRCLDSNYAGSAYTSPCYAGGDTYQEWAMFETEYGRDTLNDLQTGRCLDSNSAGAVYTDSCNGDDTYQNWSLGGDGPGYTLQDLQTGLCLDSNSSGSLYTDPCNWNNYYQNWSPTS